MKTFATMGLLLLLGACSYSPLADGLSPAGTVVTDHRDYIEILPASGNVDPVGLMFWPGGLVDPQAYRASLGVFAARGYRVIIAKVPLNLAITSIEKGLALKNQLGGEWVAAGHSLGGTTAAWTIYDNPTAFKGLALLASYPAESTPLDTWDRPVLSLHGEFDGLATPAKIDSFKGLLPATTVYQTLEGGNHGQFGDYGLQDGDGAAAITKQAQWVALADALETLWGTL